MICKKRSKNGTSSSPTTTRPPRPPSSTPTWLRRPASRSSSSPSPSPSSLFSPARSWPKGRRFSWWRRWWTLASSSCFWTWTCYCNYPEIRYFLKCLQGRILKAFLNISFFHALSELRYIFQVLTLIEPTMVGERAKVGCEKSALHLPRH